MCQTIKRLGDAELEIMQIFWEADEPLTAAAVQEKLRRRRPWPLSTLMTSLSRLVDKGFLSCDRTARNNLYAPLVAEEAYKLRESRSFLEKLYGNSFLDLVATLYGGKALGDDDLAELRRFLDDCSQKGEP